MAYYSFKRRTNIYSRFAIYGVIAIVIAYLQMLLLDLIAIENVTPDLLIILIIWITIYEGKLHGIFSGFFIGLIFDILSFDLIGTNALAKTFVGFVASSFYHKEREQLIPGTYKFPLIVLLSSFIHNLIYYFFYINVSELVFWEFFLKYGIASSFYTSVFSLFVMFFNLRKRY